jgi:hypothetical protein
VRLIKLQHGSFRLIFYLFSLSLLFLTAHIFYFNIIAYFLIFERGGRAMWVKLKPEAETDQKNAASPKSRMSRGNILKTTGMMKKGVISFLLIVGIVAPSMSQIFFYPPNFKPDLMPIKGGEEGKNYAVIINTKLSKRDLVDKTGTFLAKYQLIKPEYLKLDEITEGLSEYTIPVALRQAFNGISAMMGLKIVVPPVVIGGNLRFEFHDNGNVMIVWENLKETVFCETDGERLVNYDRDKNPDMAEYYGLYAAATLEGSAILTVLIVANKGFDGLQEWNKKFDDYFAEIDSKYKVLDDVKRAGKGEWLLDADYVKYLEKSKMSEGKGGAQQLNLTKQYYDEGRILAVNVKRWETKIKPLVADLFKTINVYLEGTIKGVAEDGEQTYIEIDGTVLPVDPKWENKTPPTDAKEREKYIKKNIKKQY